MISLAHAAARRFPVLAGAAFAVALAATPVVAQSLEPLAVVSGGKRHEFQVEVARTDAERQQGLMYRRSLAPDRGMLFDFQPPQVVSMWMKNTYIPLDMLFIRSDGTIANIAANTEPLSTRSVTSAGLVTSVLEVPAGTAARLGINAGDRVEHPLFKKP